MKFTKLAILAAAVASLLGLASQGRADSIDPTPKISGGPLSGAGYYFEGGPSGSPLVYHYSVTFVVTGGSDVQTNDFFELDQFQGATVSNWNFTGANWDGTTSNSTAIHYTYTGVPTIGNPTSPVTLGTLTFDSATDFSKLPVIVLDPLNDKGQIGGHAQYDGGTGNYIHLVAAPLPSAAWMGLSGLAALGLAGFTRRRMLRA